MLFCCCPAHLSKGELGLQVTDALSRGTDVVLRLDVQGAATVRRLLPDAVSVFLVRHAAASKPPTNFRSR